MVKIEVVIRYYIDKHEDDEVFLRGRLARYLYPLPKPNESGSG
jgi:hypothetical protein